jgi:hypothetical protein
VQSASEELAGAVSGRQTTLAQDEMRVFVFQIGVHANG